MLSAQVFATFALKSKYGLDTVGEYVMVLTISQITIVGISQPFSSLIRRDLSLKNQHDSNNYISNVNYLRVVNMLVVIVLAILIIPFFSNNISKLAPFLILMLLAKGFEMLNDTYFVTYQALSKFKLYAILKIGFAILSIGNVAAMYLSTYELETFYIIQVVCALVFLVINKVISRAKGISKNIVNVLNLKFSSELKYLLKSSWPLILSGSVFQASSKINIFVIYSIIGAKDLGIFSILLLISNIFSGASSSIGVVVIGKFTILINRSFKEFKRIFSKSLFLFFAAGFLLALLYILAYPIIQNFYKLETSKIFYVNVTITLTIPILFLTGCIGNIFLILKKQILTLYVTLTVLLVNIPIYIILVKVYGLNGAGYAYFITALFQLCLMLYLTYMVLNKNEKFQ